MSITLTEQAAGHVKRFAEREGQDPTLRLRVKTTGCSGYMYEVELCEASHEHDKVFESHGGKRVSDDQSYPFLAGTEIDFARDGLNEGFKFINPNVAATCGCGESFTV